MPKSITSWTDAYNILEAWLRLKKYVGKIVIRSTLFIPLQDIQPNSQIYYKYDLSAPYGTFLVQEDGTVVDYSNVFPKEENNGAK